MSKKFYVVPFVGVFPNIQLSNHGCISNSKESEEDLEWLWLVDALFLDSLSGNLNDKMFLWGGLKVLVMP